MNSADLEHFKELILTKRDQLLQDLNSLKDQGIVETNREASGDLSAYSYHMADQGTDAQEREKAFHFLSRDSKYLVYLNEALERIERGEYGICIECGEPISRERLEAVPHAQLCVPCKNKRKADGRDS